MCSSTATVSSTVSISIFALPVWGDCRVLWNVCIFLLCDHQIFLFFFMDSPILKEVFCPKTAVIDQRCCSLLLRWASMWLARWFSGAVNFTADGSSWPVSPLTDGPIRLGTVCQACQAEEWEETESKAASKTKPWWTDLNRLPHRGGGGKHGKCIWMDEKKGGRSRRLKKARAQTKIDERQRNPVWRRIISVQIVDRKQCLFLPIQRISEVRICRYLVFWALKKANGPNRSVKTACRQDCWD